MRLNHPERVHEHPAHLVSPDLMWKNSCSSTGVRGGSPVPNLL